MAHTSESESDDSEVEMGGYTDLPPEERPGYKPPKQEQKGPGYSTTPYPQWGHNAPTGMPYSAVPPRNAPAGAGRGISFSQLQGGFNYTAKPVVKPKKPLTPMDMPVPPAQFPGYDGRKGSNNNGLPPPPPMPGSFGGPPPPRGPPGGFNDIPPPPMMPMSAGPQGMPGGWGNELPPPPGSSQIPRNAVIREMTPGGMKPPSPMSAGGLRPGGRPHGASFSGGTPNLRAPSPGGLGQKMHRLSVNTDRPDMQAMMAGGRPPGSPMLEAYHGTYQSMPSPMVMPGRFRDEDIDNFDLERHSSRTDHRKRSSSPKKKPKKNVTLYNEEAEDDARAIASQLSSAKPDFGVLIEIIPHLDHDQIMELRTEYKRVCKIQGHGINIAKHIKMKMSGNLKTIAYVIALGRWESEGYWANFWYQSQTSKRELLIESLMGRPNSEIRLIKRSFKDKRYQDDLVKCMDKELKADKFREAVLKALEEKRQEENERYPAQEVDYDVEDLYKALRKREGGETAILDIVLTRSDAHLREVLKLYERKYQSNFAKDCLKKSVNLVGEVVAHILNGVINRPARDAMLLHHALMDLKAAHDDRDDRSDDDPRSSKTNVKEKAAKKERYELLISRLTRLHWDKMHFIRTKLEYKDKYNTYLEEDIEDNVRGNDFVDFCIELCEAAK